MLRRLDEGDYESLCALFGDAETMRYIGGPWSRERVRKELARILAEYEQTETGWNAITDRATGEFLGVCWLAPLSAAVREALQWEPRIEIGNYIARPHWNRGYATEAGAALLRHAFLELGHEEVVAIANPRSLASDRVLEKLGMTYRKTFLLDAVPLNLYTLTRQEFLAATA